MSLLREFVTLSKYAGLRQDLIQAGGGNSSVKIDNQKMYIKASGYHLADMTEDSGFSIVDYKLIQDYFVSGKSDILTEEEIITKGCLDGKRPSIETFLHAITGTYTLHTHPIAANILLCRKDGMAELRELFPDAVFVDYRKPGLSLAKIFFEAARTSNKRETEIFFLKNHGLVVSANTLQDVIDKTEDILLLLEKYLGVDFERYRNVTRLTAMVEKCGYDFGNIYSCNDFDVRTMAKDGMWRYDFCPDCLVYGGKSALIIENVQDITTYFEKYGKPSVLWYRGNCYICAGNLLKAKEIESMLNFSIHIAEYNKNDEISYLADEEQDLIINWDAEKYRRSLVNK